MPICRLCRVREANSGEHLFQSALGGRLEVPGVLCKPCNERLGAGIDADLAESLLYHRVALAIKGDRGQTATMRVVDAEGRVIILHPGLLPESAETRPEVTWLDERTMNTTVANEKQARQVVRAHQRKHPDQALTVNTTKVRKIFPAPINIEPTFVANRYFPAAVKTALVLLAYAKLESVVSLSDAWRYIDGQPPDQCGVTPVWCAAHAPWQDPSLGAVPHRVSVRGNVEASRLEVDVRYFGDFAICAYIATSVSAPFSVGYGVDPMTHKSARCRDWTGAVGAPHDQRIGEVHAATLRAMDNMTPLIEVVARREFVTRTVKQCTKKVVGSDRPGPFTLEQYIAISKCAAEEVAFFLNREDGEELAPDLQAALQEAADKLRPIKPQID